MKKQKLSINWRLIFNRLLILLFISFFVALFVFKEDLTNYSSKIKQQQTDAGTILTQSLAIDSCYNYNNNNLPYSFTFLEFGAKGCSSCKRMEGVMNEISTKYPNLVNVVFLNIRLPENQSIMDYFGIVAIPTQVILNKDGKEFFRHTGYYSAQELEKLFI
jgi:thioredoxin 1